MKRILALILCGIMLFSLIACGKVETPETTESTDEIEDTEDTEDSEDSENSEDSKDTNDTEDEDNNTSTDSSSSASTNQSTTSSSTGGNTGTDRPKPSLVPDRTKYNAKTDGNVIYYASEAIMRPVLTSYYNGYKTALSMTFDDGYDLGTGTAISDQFERFGFRGTMMIGVTFINSDTYVEGWNNVFARGYLDLGCHAWAHKEPTSMSYDEYEHEIKDAIMYLREKFPTQRVLTFATPYAHINNSYQDYLSQFVIGNRLEAGGSEVVLGKDFDPYRVKAISVNERANMTTVQGYIADYVKRGVWIVELYHCILSPAVNGTDMDKDKFAAHCEWLYRNYRDDIWFASFEDVLIYSKQHEHTTVTYTACDKDSMTFEVKSDSELDRSIYNFDMSLKVYIPNEFFEVDSVCAEVNGKAQYLEVKYEDITMYKYVVVTGIPVTEDATVQVFMGGNKIMKNNCVPHKYITAEVVEPTHESGGYTLYECTKCANTYKGLYTAPVHDYSGEVVVAIEPTKFLKGLAKHYCTQCDKYEVRDKYFQE